MMLLALILAQSASTYIDGTTSPHTVVLDCRVVSLTADDVMRFAATVEYSGGSAGHNHHVHVRVKPVNNDFPSAETHPAEGGSFSNRPFAMVDSWRGQELFYSFELPSKPDFGSVAESGIARLDLMVGDYPGERIAAGLCTMSVESRTA